MSAEGRLGADAMEDANAEHEVGNSACRHAGCTHAHGGCTHARGCDVDVVSVMQYRAAHRALAFTANIMGLDHVYNIRGVAHTVDFLLDPLIAK
jgi:hypothetical protein